jgi:2-polyprenyl-6-methoxyphenol hydroxylase-like FAD-dependent oxidoreductase
VERSPTLRNTGQQIDIRSHAVEVIKLMGLLQDVRDLTVHELGVRFVDWEGKE